MASTSTSPPPTIAVVAVHGVADQKPGESARAIAQMLLGLRQRLNTRFTSFREFGIALPNRRVEIEEAPPGSRRRKRSDVRPEFIRESRGGTVSEADYQFMRELLGKYRQAGEDGVYQTIRLEGGRLADESEGQGPASVHVYEAYWADLSRVSDRLYRIVGEFYQLILHLPFLGLQAIDFRLHAPDNGSLKWWAHHRWVYNLCLRIFTLPLPILNILLFALGLTVLPGKINSSWHAYVAVGLAAILSGVLFNVYLLRRWVVRSWVAWIPSLVATILVTLLTARAVGFFTQSGHITSGLYPQFGFLWWLAIGGLLLPFFRGYDRHRPGIRAWAIVFYLAITPAFAVALHAESNSEAGLQQAMLRTLELTFFLLWFFWLVLAVVATWHLLFGWTARIFDRSFRAGSPSSRALFTSMLALALSISIFSQTTILIWAALLTTVAPMLVPDTVLFTPLIFKDPSVRPEDATVAHFLRTLLNLNGAPIFIGGMILSVVVVLLVIWAMWPSVWTELRPIRRSTGPTAAARAQRYGHWLSSGFRLMRFAGELVGIAVIVGTVIAGITLRSRLPGGHPIDWPTLLRLTPDSLLPLKLVGAITGTVAGLFALGRLADALALGFRPALDVLLDVDNYLRDHPRNRTPRARIAERYATLLRHLCRWKDRSPGSNGTQYSAIIIIAHSQGTVITADLLRFLRRERRENPLFEPDLDRLLSDAPTKGRLPVYLFTMGCPLRQLYRLRFPDLYRWVDPPDPSSGMGPDPGALGVTRWVNVYRSGDYVGRSLWTPDSDAHLFTPEPRPREIDAVRSEGCIGAGAHTHYWDDTAPMVADELDRLIVHAIAAAAPRPQ
jgi:hypothetical protein